VRQLKTHRNVRPPARHYISGASHPAMRDILSEIEALRQCNRSTDNNIVFDSNHIFFASTSDKTLNVMRSKIR